MIKEYGNEIPNLNQLISVLKNDFLIEYNKFNADHENDEFIVTFEGLIKKSAVISEIKAILALLQDKLGYAWILNLPVTVTAFICCMQISECMS